jgi:hypothetical protein
VENEERGYLGKYIIIRLLNKTVSVSEVIHPKIRLEFDI